MAATEHPEPKLHDLRGLQANERTLLAWIRTSVSLISFGFAIGKLGDWVDKLGHHGHADRGTVILGGLFALLGAFAQIVGLTRYLTLRRAIVAGEPAPVGGAAIRALAVAIGCLGLFAAVYVFL